MQTLLLQRIGDNMLEDLLELRRILDRFIAKYQEQDKYRFEHDPRLAEEFKLQDDDRLNISFIGGNDKIFNKYFEIPLMDIQQETVKITIEDTDVELIMTSKSFHELINQFQNFDENLSLHFTEEEVSMFSDGIYGLMKVNINLDDVTEYSVVEDLDIKQTYSLKYIAMMCLFNKLSDEFNMTFSEDKPMTGRYDLDDESFVKFYLATKVIDDE